jgi:hypothetical protein
VIKRITIIGAVITGALALAGTASASAATAPRASGVGFASASTQLTNHPDSSAQGGNWALTKFTRSASVMITGVAPNADCPGMPATALCISWAGQISDTGTFTTIAGALAPRTGTEDQALTGTFKGGSSTIRFFADSIQPSGSRVPAVVNGDVSGKETTTSWVEQFFPAGTIFNSAANPGGVDLGAWSWTYALARGTDHQCSSLPAQTWVDSLANGDGANAGDGNILTPDAAHC